MPGTSYQYQVVAVYDDWIAPSYVSNAITLSASTLSSFTLTPSTLAPTAGISFSVALTALDQYGNADAAYTGPECVTFSAPDDASGDIAPAYPPEGACAAASSVTFTGGVQTVSVTLVDPETSALEVTDNSSGASGASAPIAVTGSAVPSTTTTTGTTTTTTNAGTTSTGTTTTGSTTTMTAPAGTTTATTTTTLTTTPQN